MPPRKATPGSRPVAIRWQFAFCSKLELQKWLILLVPRRGFKAPTTVLHKRSPQIGDRINLSAADVTTGIEAAKNHLMQE